MNTAYDHYVNIPMATSLGDFGKPERMLIYSARTEGYKGEPVKGVDRLFEATGDFVSVVFRVMPHANDQERFKRIVSQMQSVKLVTLAEFRGGKAKPINDIKFPPVGVHWRGRKLARGERRLHSKARHVRSGDLLSDPTLCAQLSRSFGCCAGSFCSEPVTFSRRQSSERH
jgi:hypothetical protein